jgi:hypothetical protein
VDPDSTLDHEERDHEAGGVRLRVSGAPWTINGKVTCGRPDLALALLLDRQPARPCRRAVDRKKGSSHLRKSQAVWFAASLDAADGCDGSRPPEQL